MIFYVIQKGEDYYLSEYGAFNYKLSGAKLFENQEEARKIAQKLGGKVKELVLKDADLTLKVKKLTDTAKLPVKAHATDAAFDIYADEDTTITGLTSSVLTGIALEIPAGYYGRIVGRSGMTLGTPLKVFEGIIDSGYRGEIKIMCQCVSDSVRIMRIKKGERIAQLLIEKVEDITIVESDSLETTDRGESGFGSTGR